jgi:hypothetical protein
VTLEGKKKNIKKDIPVILQHSGLHKSMSGKKVRVETIYFFVGFTPQAPHCEIYSTIRKHNQTDNN